MSSTDLVVSGFPRSGNNFLAYTIAALTGAEPRRTNHTVYAIDNADRVLVPVRHPRDCIASWNHFRGTRLDELAADMAYYQRINEAALAAPQAVLLDFSVFTVDVAYVAEAAGLPVPPGVSVESVRQAMLDAGRAGNLPQDNQEELDAIKVELDVLPEYAACVDMYQVAVAAALEAQQ